MKKDVTLWDTIFYTTHLFGSLRRLSKTLAEKNWRFGADKLRQNNRERQ